MKSSKNTDQEEIIKNYQTLPEEPNTMRQLTHYFSVPETPNVRIQPSGRKIQNKKSQKHLNQTPQKRNLIENLALHPAGIRIISRIKVTSPTLSTGTY